MNLLYVRQVKPVYWFFLRNTLWIITMAAIIFVMIRIISKYSNKKIAAIVAEKPIVGFAAGILVVLEGISHLANAIPSSITSVMATLETSQLTERQDIILGTILSNIHIFVAIIGQIAVGLYFMKTYKKRLN